MVNSTNCQIQFCNCWIRKFLSRRISSYLEGYSWQSSRPSFTPMALGIRSGGGDCHKEYFISTIVVPFLFLGCEAIVSFLRASDQFNAADVRDPTFTRSFIRWRFHPVVLSGARSFFPLIPESMLLPRIRTYRNYTLKLRIIVSFMRNKQTDISQNIEKSRYNISGIYLRCHFFAKRVIGWIRKRHENGRKIGRCTFFYLKLSIIFIRYVSRTPRGMHASHSCISALFQLTFFNLIQTNYPITRSLWFCKFQSPIKPIPFFFFFSYYSLLIFFSLFFLKISNRFSLLHNSSQTIPSLFRFATWVIHP